MYWHVGNCEQNSLVFHENREWRDLLMPVARFFLRILRGRIASLIRQIPARGPKPTIRVLFERFYVWKWWELIKILELRWKWSFSEISKKMQKNNICEPEQVWSSSLYKFPWWIQSFLFENTMSSSLWINFNKSIHFLEDLARFHHWYCQHLYLFIILKK